jgi:hypothetical protein
MMPSKKMLDVPWYSGTVKRSVLLSKDHLLLYDA